MEARLEKIVTNYDYRNFPSAVLEGFLKEFMKELKPHIPITATPIPGDKAKQVKLSTITTIIDSDKRQKLLDLINELPKMMPVSRVADCNEIVKQIKQII